MESGVFPTRNGGQKASVPRNPMGLCSASLSNLKKKKKHRQNLWTNSLDTEQQIEQDINPWQRGNQIGEPYDNLLPRDDKLTYHLTDETLTAWREFPAVMQGRYTQQSSAASLSWEDRVQNSERPQWKEFAMQGVERATERPLEICKCTPQNFSWAVIITCIWGKYSRPGEKKPPAVSGRTI